MYPAPRGDLGLGPCEAGGSRQVVKSSRACKRGPLPSGRRGPATSSVKVSRRKCPPTSGLTHSSRGVRPEARRWGLLPRSSLCPGPWLFPLRPASTARSFPHTRIVPLGLRPHPSPSTCTCAHQLYAHPTPHPHPHSGRRVDLTRSTAQTATLRYPGTTSQCTRL